MFPAFYWDLRGIRGGRWDNSDPELGFKDPTGFVGSHNQVLKIPPTQLVVLSDST